MRKEAGLVDGFDGGCGFAVDGGAAAPGLGCATALGGLGLDATAGLRALDFAATAGFGLVGLTTAGMGGGNGDQGGGRDQADQYKFEFFHFSFSFGGCRQDGYPANGFIGRNLCCCGGFVN